MEIGNAAGTAIDVSGLGVQYRQNPTVRGGPLYGSYQGQNGARLKIESLIPFAQRPFPSWTWATASPE